MLGGVIATLGGAALAIGALKLRKPEPSSAASLKVSPSFGSSGSFSPVEGGRPLLAVPVATNGVQFGRRFGFLTVASQAGYSTPDGGNRPCQKLLRAALERSRILQNFGREAKRQHAAALVTSMA